jgi:hypothetical protein
MARAHPYISKSGPNALFGTVKSAGAGAGAVSLRDGAAPGAAPLTPPSSNTGGKVGTSTELQGGFK